MAAVGAQAQGARAPAHLDPLLQDGAPDAVAGPVAGGVDVQLTCGDPGPAVDQERVDMVALIARVHPHEAVGLDHLSWAWDG
eukprot:10483742-Alexandrium_andersonii.AAC.1